MFFYGNRRLGEWEVVLHVEPRMHNKTGLAEGLFNGAGAIEEKLRLDPVDIRRVQQQIDERAQHGVGDVQGHRGIVGQCKSVPDDGFVSLIDAEGEATDAAAVQGDEARQDAGIEVLDRKSVV